MDTAEIRYQFRALREEHVSKLGVDWHMSHYFSENNWYFSCFCRRDYYSEARNGPTKGNGAKALREVCELADKLGVTLQLDTVYEKLYGYYESFGFANTRTRGKSRIYVRPALEQQRAAA